MCRARFCSHYLVTCLLSLFVLTGCDTGGLDLSQPGQHPLPVIEAGTFTATIPLSAGEVVTLRGLAKVSASTDPHGPSVELQFARPATDSAPAYHIVLSSNRNGIWPSGTYAIGAGHAVAPKAFSLTPDGRGVTTFALGVGAMEIKATSRSLWGTFTIATAYAEGKAIEGTFHAVRAGE